jgi:hypothetical protein
MKYQDIEISQEEIAAYCRANGIRRLAFFGSILRDDFQPESDVDVLVEFDPDARVGLRFFEMQDELSNLLGHAVGLYTVGALEKHVRGEVLSEADVQFESTR